MKKLEELSQIYEVNFDRLSFTGIEEYDRNQVVNQGYTLLVNPWVQSLLLRAKEEVFSRPDSVSAEERFQEVIHSVVRLAGYFNNLDGADFLEMKPYIGMIKSLNELKRKGPQSSLFSKRIQVGLNYIFQKYVGEMSKLQVRPSVYGSARHGDANEQSDIDLNFLVSGGVTDEKIDLVGEMEFDINFNLKPHQIRDYCSARELIVDLDEMHAALMDIVDGETTCLSDYSFKEIPFYPYNFIIEGKSFAGHLGKVDAEAKSIKRNIDLAIKEDPFFEFIICFGLFNSIQKRQEKI